jgi:hypothetical protein
MSLNKESYQLLRVQAHQAVFSEESKNAWNL